MNIQKVSSTQEDAHIQSKDTAQHGLLEKLPSLLRILGATALIFATYSFLIKGWQNGNDILRYLLLLGHTTLLATIGLASGHFLKESKSARLLLILALVTVPVNFAILGAFIYFHATTHIDTLPDYVSWATDSLKTALLATGSSLLLLIPIILLGFTALARNISGKLTVLFLLSNAVLLIPLRDPQIIGLSVLILTLLIMTITRKFAYNQAAVKTKEGIIALSLQLLPLTVLAVRNLWLYSPDIFLYAVSCITIFLFLRQAALYLETRSKLRHLFDGISVLPALLIIPSLGDLLSDSLHCPPEWVLPLSVLISAVMIDDISRRNQNATPAYRRIAVIIILLGMGLNILLFDGLLASLCTVVTGLLLVIYGYHVQHRSVFISGFILATIGMAQQLFELVYRFELSNWVSFTVLGVIAIVTASIIESQGIRIKNRINTWKTAAFHQWQQ